MTSSLHVLLATALLNASAALAQQPAPLTAQQIMARVAANQDSSVAERARYVYLQHARVTSRKGKTVRCEEITDSRIAPSPSGSQPQLLKLDGRLLQKGQYLTYTQLPANASTSDDIHISIGGSDANDTDRQLVEEMRHNLTDDKTKDGLGADLFPLTSKSQAAYEFKLAGREPMNGRDTFHIAFQPKDHSDFSWKGDAWIDAAAFQPVLVRTTMSRKLPFAVRTLLGTSLPGLGFTVIYAPQPDGVWFPISFGTEFKLRILFFFSREIVISAANRDFEKTHVHSEILSAPPTPPANTPK